MGFLTSLPSLGEASMAWQVDLQASSSSPSLPFFFLFFLSFSSFGRLNGSEKREYVLCISEMIHMGIIPCVSPYPKRLQHKT